MCPIPTVAPLSISGTKVVYLNGTTDYINFTAYCSENPDGELLKADGVSSTWFSVHLIAYGEGFTGPTGDAGSSGTPSTWSTYPALQTVDMSGQALSNWSYIRNAAGLDISGTSISGLTTLNGQAVSSIGGSTWSTFPATQTVDMSGQGLSNWSYLRDAAGLDISGTSISGLTTLNGQAVSSIGGSTWSTFKAIQTVDMSGNSVSNLGTLSLARVSTSTLTPSNAGISGLALWLDAADATTLTLSGASVTAWRDKSGNNRTTTVNSTPSYSATGFGGKPTVTCALNSITTTIATAPGTNVSVFFVGIQNGGNVVDVGGYQLFYRGDFQAYCFYQSGGGGMGNSAYTASNVQLVISALANNATQYWYVTTNGYYNRNMGLGGFDSAPFTSSSTSVTVGNFNGQICELIVYNGTLGTTQRQQLEGYLAWKWGLNTSLINTHPYFGAAPTIPTNTLITFGTETIDSNFDLAIAATNTIRLQAPTDWRYNMATVSTGTLTLSSTNTGVAYRVTGSLSNVTVPTLTTGAAGAYWEFLNATTSNLSVTLTGTTDITSPITIYPGGTYRIRWSGTAFSGNQDKDVPTSSWSTLPALSTVDMSGQALTKWSYIRDASGLDLSGTSIGGLTSESFNALPTTFSPTEIANCQLWFDVADSTKVDLSGSNIIRLRDKSGNGYDASLNGTNTSIYGPTINGRNCIQFASNDTGRFQTQTITSSSNQRTAFYAGRWAPWTVALSTLPPGFYLAITPLAGTAATCNVSFGLQRNPDNTTILNMNAGGSYSISSFIGGGNYGYIYSNTLIGWMMDMSGTGARYMSFNGTLQAGGGTFGNGMATSSAFQIGPTMRGFYLGEVIMYNGAMTQSNYQKVEGYLAWKWGITLPAGHPYVSAPPTGTTVSATQPLGIATTDAYGNLYLVGSNSVRAGTFRYRQAISEVGPTLTVTANESGMNYRFSNSLGTITVPSTLGSNDAGTFWTFYNPFTSSLSITLAGVPALDISSPVSFNPGSTYILRWTGSNYIGSQDKEIFTTSTRVGILSNAPRFGFQGNTQTALNAVDIAGQVYGRLPVFIVSTTTLDITTNFAAYANTYFYITNSAFSNVSLPASTATSNGGTFFQLKNATSSYLSVTVNATLTLTSPVVIPPSNAVTLVVSPNAANTMLLF
jgi:hypothetical protein